MAQVGPRPKSRNDVLRRLPRREAGRAVEAAAATCRYLGTVRPRSRTGPAAVGAGCYAAFCSASPPTIDDIRVRPSPRPSWPGRRFAFDEPWRVAWPLPLKGAVRQKLSAAAIEQAPLTPSSDFAVVPPPGTIPLPFLLADIGEGITEVELLEWHVSPGDSVEEHQTMCDVQSNKATVPLTSRYAGTVVDLCGMKEDMVSTGSPLMHVAVEKGKYRTDADANEAPVAQQAALSPPSHAKAAAADSTPSPEACSSTPLINHISNLAVAKSSSSSSSVSASASLSQFLYICPNSSSSANINVLGVP